MKLIPLRPKLLSCRRIPQLAPELARALGCDPERHRSAGLVTTDQDDSTYVALDECTKHAPVDVVFAKSFYAGAAHASGPLSGEILGIIAGANPDDVDEALLAFRRHLAEEVCFYQHEGERQPAFFPHAVPAIGSYLSTISGLPIGSPLAYLIAPPIEATIGIDAALKNAEVRLVKWFGPPTETNFAGAYLTGSIADVESAARTFAEQVGEVARSPLEAAIRPSRERR